MDLHQGQIQGFFSIPVDELTAVHMLSAHFRRKKLQRPVVVTDLGFAKRARAFAELLDAPLAVIEKRREGNLDRAELMNVIGEVRGRQAIIVDDEIDTAGTLMEVVNALENEGVTEMYACATHAVLSDPAVDRIREMPLAELVVTDTIPLPPAKRLRKIKVISTAPLIGEAMRRIHHGESVGELFSSELDLVQEMSLWEERNGGGGDGNGGDGSSGDGGADRGDDQAGQPGGGQRSAGRAIPIREPASPARARAAGPGPA
jgi:ribose-phosphate pyrophosphokinase